MRREQRLPNSLLGLFSGLSLLCLTLPLAGPVRSFKTLIAYVVFPGPRATFWATETLAGVPDNLSGLIRADQENRELREKLQAASLAGARTDTIEAENTRLRALLGFAPAGRWSPLWARVMGRDPRTWYRELILDRGRNDGLELGAPVLALEGVDLGVVGRVIEVSPNTAKVLLVTDEFSSIAAVVGPEGWEGLIEGAGRPLLKLDYLSGDAKLVAGMRVVTSPISPSFPPGLPLGSIEKIGAQDPLLAFQSAEIRPAARLGTLKEVMVLRKAGT